MTEKVSLFYNMNFLFHTDTYFTELRDRGIGWPLLMQCTKLILKNQGLIVERSN